MRWFRMRVGAGRWRGCWPALFLAMGPGADSIAAADKVTFADHVLPLVEQHCGKCHNSDKRKGDLDLTSHAGVIKGGASGPVAAAGNPDGSKLIRVLLHAEEPTMPPNKPPLPEKDLAVFRQWIAGGLLETSGSKALVSARPAVDFALKTSPSSRPEGPPPMPGDLRQDPVVTAARRGPVLGLAASPWAPVVAVAGQKQVLFYDTTDFTFLGLLPTGDAQPWEIRFSRSGRVLLIGGGHGAKSGQVQLWRVETGEALGVVGREYDTVLAADLSPDQTRVVLGGPDRWLKLYPASGGEPEFKLKKHTDWITAAAFSPSGEMVATADRNGGITVWNPDNGQELFTTAGHKGAVTALSWRGDSRLLASASEDGTVKLWESAEGKQAKTWNAHGGGALSVAYARDGRLASAGRDGAVTLWSGEGVKIRTLAEDGEPVTRCAWTHEDARVVTGDFAGRVRVWDARDGRRLAELESNPAPLADRLEAARRRVASLRGTNGPAPAPAPVPGAETARREAARELERAVQAAAVAKSNFTAHGAKVVRLKAAAAAPDAAPALADQLAAARAAREQARGVHTNTTVALAAIRQRQADATPAASHPDPAVELAAAEGELARLTRAMAASGRPGPAGAAGAGAGKRR